MPLTEHNMVMSQSEVSALKETLCAQQNLLQKLYNELDAERESSATAASEALSVILRLQGEKAAIKMEAEQYKRLAEEKMCHAEESMEIIEDIIYQKEMEVASLDYQVQAYRYKLVSLGCVDPGVGEIKFPENLLQRNEALVMDTSSIRKRGSTPIPLKYKKGSTFSRESSISPEIDLTLTSGQEVSDSEGIISYGEQIRKLDERVKEIAGVNYTNEALSPLTLSSRPSASNLQNETRSPSPQLSIGSSYDSKKEALLNEINQFKPPAIITKNGAYVDYSCSSNVHDVFEVPQVDEFVTKDKKKTVCEGSESESLEREDIIHPKPYGKDEPDWLKKLLQSTHRDNSLCKPSDIAAKGGHLAVVQTRTSVTESQTRLNQLNTTSEIIDSTIDGHLAVVEPSTSVSESQPRLNQLNRTSEINEVEATSTNREEEMKLLNEIKERLNLLQNEIRNLKVKKSSTKDEEEPSLVPLSEAMLYFWL